MQDLSCTDRKVCLRQDCEVAEEETLKDFSLREFAVWADLVIGHLENRTYTRTLPNSPKVTLDTGELPSNHKDLFACEDEFCLFSIINYTFYFKKKSEE